jgi:hypothetical protein
VSNRRTIALSAALSALCLGAPAPGALAAPAAGGGTTAGPRLWATVNVCDTEAKPDAIGIRGSMPGNGDRTQRMFMRFQVQYHGRDDRRWHNTGPNGDSGFIDVGSGRYHARQAGRTFTVTAPPAAVQGFRLRGMVTFEWRRDGEVVRRERRRTTGSHPDTRGADPVGFTAGSCVIR